MQVYVLKLHYDGEDNIGGVFDSQVKAQSAATLWGDAVYTNQSRLPIEEQINFGYSILPLLLNEVTF